ncbi:MAG: hypothetical protein R3E84_19595 [Pseudomonadales bacterium]
MTDKTPNHSLSPQRCPVTLADIDLFAEGAQEHWYEAYPILHAEAPVLRLPGEGMYPDTDGYVLTRYEDINTVVKDPVRFPPTLSLGIQALLDSGVPPEEAPLTNAMLASMATLRPTNELYRTHRQELTDPWVGPGASRHTEMIARHANALIDDWIDRGEMDFIHEFARPLPQRVMASVLGFPRKTFRVWQSGGPLRWRLSYTAGRIATCLPTIRSGPSSRSWMASRNTCTRG